MHKPRVTAWRPSRDTACAAGGAALFSLALGLATVAVPLLALEAGYSGAEIGVLTAISGLSQLGIRLIVGPAMRVLPDWTLIAASGLLLAAGNALLAISTAMIPFIITELIHGSARGFFWTGSQTHVVRGKGSSVGALAKVNLISSLGLLGGPILAGLLAEHSLRLTMGVGAAVAVIAIIPTFFLDRLPPFVLPADRPPGRLWRRPGVSAGCWAGFAAGTWRGLLSSYVPVALDTARQSSTTIGALVSVANGASVVGAGIVGRIRGREVTRTYAAGILVTGVGTAVMALFADHIWAAAIALAVSGLGAGALQTVGPAMAADAVHPEERGDAIAVAGTFRAAALLFGPLAVAGLVTVMPLTIAMAGAGALIALPAVAARKLTHSSSEPAAAERSA